MNISAHAIIRYLERADGVDMKALRRRFRSAYPQVEAVSDGVLLAWLELAEPGLIANATTRLEATCRTAFAIGASALTRDGLRYVFRDGVLISVTPASGHAKRRPRDRSVWNARHAPSEDRAA